MAGKNEIGIGAGNSPEPCLRCLHYQHPPDNNHDRPEEIDRMLIEGAPAPDFTALDHTGNEIRLSGLRGKKVWLWFFSSPGGGN